MSNEAQIQSAIMDFLRVALPGSYRAIHVNNTPRSAIHGARLKKMGLKAGVADILILSGHNGVACIEVKAEKGKLSPPQREFETWCHESRIPHCVARNVCDVETFLLDLGVPLKARAA